MASMITNAGLAIPGSSLGPTRVTRKPSELAASDSLPAVVRAEAQPINQEIMKTEAKVVDSELAKPVTPYCRCWRSGTFPLFDRSHVKHNKATGDNVGLLLLKNV